MKRSKLFFANPGAQVERLRAPLDAAINDVLEGGVFVHGPAHDQFEAEFAAYLGVKHVVGVANGTDALVLALRAAGVRAGDEVVAPAHTAPPTISAIRQVGAIPKFIDVNSRTYVVDFEDVAAAITPATRAIIGVHLYGRPFNAPLLRQLADEKGIILIEDCAQAAGASIGSRRVGTFGHFGCFSFFPTKNLGAIGDGGAVVTGDDDAAGQLQRLRTYGWSKDRLCIEDGTNSRLDELQAAILLVKLRHLDADNKRRREIAELYNEMLSGLLIDLPLLSSDFDIEQVFHLYVIASDHRAALMSHLLEASIVCGIHYAVPCHMHAAHQRFSSDALIHTEQLAGRIVSLPMYPELSQDDIERVCQEVRNFFK